MPRKVRTTRTPDTKAKVALAAIQGNQTLAQIASVHGVLPIQVTQWKNQLIAGAPGCFTTQTQAATKSALDVDKLYERIGQLDMELQWLKKKLAGVG
jgi:transposase-like protein